MDSAFMTRTLSAVEKSTRVSVYVSLHPGVSDLNFMHSHGGLHTSSELGDTLFLLVDLIISRDHR